MPRVRITRRLHFCAAHRLAREDWSEEKNRRVFGDCANPNWHGHNYDLEVTVAGPVDEETGYVMELGALKALVNRLVVDDLDHSNLHLDVPWVEGIIPSTENLAVAIWERIVAHIPAPAALDRVVLWETPRQWAEYRGE